VDVSEKSQVVAATVVGAALGGLAGYVLFSEPGRRLYRGLGPALDDLTSGLEGLLRTFGAAAGLASEGWRLLSDVTEDGSRSSL
jgi:hypothetical protein